ncbi:TolC family outer membrane protein [Phenylobacterium sp.]|uniref:TolC family outer membrane protein n=2 Tax=Phenylobacterium sp. TaxID=1871053 RepID=UPI0025F76046|nr:TolC family outer membrane protein [Phenylobacterium sp.]MCA6287029.1 TolC family outer membrane protein [Phenylobacterium sp.]MCA6310299.1 TolC family outer membrane protein [Phenylobacterium sp.]MCA6324652.1 TolC family outer membrane protein [Phenylobacterium sp.]MCA6336616.1 TolC family outer membrane protein [Phenylobacterium sp.]MCA6340630.1 TolC family outer membrane protein [Phenylobacterium sp.]
MIKRDRSRWLAAGSLAALSLSVSPVAAETLAEAIAMAYASNPTLQAQRAQLRALDENWYQARAGYRPTLSVSGRATWSETTLPGARPLVDVESNSGSAVLSLTQPVYSGGRVASAVSAAEADSLSGREGLRRVEAQVLGQVIQSYVDVRRDQEALRIRQTNVAVLQRQLDESRARFEVGEITRTDVAQSEARLAAAVALLNSAQATLATSRASYEAVVGQSPGDLAPEPPFSHLMPGSIEQAWDLAESGSPVVRSAEYAEQASRARVAGARAEQMPTVALQGQLGYSGLVNPLHTDAYSRALSGSAVVTIPIFSGGQTLSRVRAASERNTVDRLGVENARRTVRQAITQSWSALQAARSNIEATDKQVRAARIAAEGVVQEQRVGLRTTIDVLNAEQELRAAELAQISARRDEYVAAAGVLGQVGRLQAGYLVPEIPRYDPAANFKSLRVTWGWVPWEVPGSGLDGFLVPKPAVIPDRPVPLPPPGGGDRDAALTPGR